MKSKQIVTVVLLVFVAASVAYLAIRPGRTPAPPPDQAAVGPAADAPAEGRHVQAYYFHRSKRCTTCNRIEAWAEDVVRTEFADALAAGTLGWKAVNFEKPENQAYKTQFEVHTQSVVLVEFVDGRINKSAALPEVWPLANDEGSFREYVRGEVAAWLER